MKNRKQDNRYECPESEIAYNEPIMRKRKIIAVIVFLGFSFWYAVSGSSQAQSGQTGVQTSPPTTGNETSSDPKAPSNSNTTVEPNKPVITIQGICAQPKGAPCKTVIAREQFEALMNALNRDGAVVSSRARQNLARSYAEFLALEAAAKKAGLEQTPEFLQVMDWVRLRTAADLYRRDLEDKYRNPSPAEIDAYYHEHLKDFDRVKLIRILVPREGGPAASQNDFDQKAKQAAAAAHDRATKGDDPGQIQKDVYTTLGLGGPPPTDLGNYGRANFTDAEGADVFSLKPGEVSQVEVEPKSYVIYKVAEKKTLTEDEMKKEISRTISEQKFKDAMKAVMDSAPAEFNEQYFGPGMSTPLTAPAKPATPPAH